MDIKKLYQKVAEFESGIADEALSHSQCMKGCARCCYTDISVFEVEAENIRSWFQNLSLEQKDKLRTQWKTPSSSTENFFGETMTSCAFLHEESCTIYEARPLICRTQGLALSFKDGAQHFVDICPLNEDMIQVLQENEFLNLDLLNMILSRIENEKSGESSRERVSLSSLRHTLLFS